MRRSVTLLFGLFFLVSSCVKDIDLSQADDLSVKTPVIITLFSLELTQHNFLDASNNEITEIEDESRIKISDIVKHCSGSQFFIDVAIDNGIDRDYTIIYDFIGNQGSVLFSKDVAVQHMTDNQNSRIVIANNDFDLFLITDKIKLRVIMNNGAPLRPLLDRRMKMKSSISFDYEY